MSKQEILCPKCGSDYVAHNALHTYVPLSEQFLYTCAECQEQFGEVDDDIFGAGAELGQSNG